MEGKLKICIFSHKDEWAGGGFMYYRQNYRNKNLVLMINEEDFVYKKINPQQNNDKFIKSIISHQNLRGWRSLDTL